MSEIEPKQAAILADQVYTAQTEATIKLFLQNKIFLKNRRFTTT